MKIYTGTMIPKYSTTSTLQKIVKANFPWLHKFTDFSLIICIFHDFDVTIFEFYDFSRFQGFPEKRVTLPRCGVVL